MGNMTEKGISGMVGNVIIYNMNGKTYVRSMPRKRPKKKGEKGSAETTIFGTVSKYGSLMGRSMANSFLFPFKLASFNALRGFLRKEYAANKDNPTWELAVKRNTLCQLNPESDLRDFLGIDITVSDKGNGRISIIIPAINPVQHIKAPLRTKKLNIKLVATTSTFKASPIPNSFTMEQYDLDYSDHSIPSKEIILDTKAAAGDIAMVVMALEFETADTGKGVYNVDRRWLPAGIVAVGRLG